MGKPKADKLETIVERILAGGGYITPAEREFICAMRKARENDVGYGWMKQVIDWEWDSIEPLRAPKCKAKGCNNHTRASHGYCFQHSDFQKYQKMGGRNGTDRN